MLCMQEKDSWDTWSNSPYFKWSLNFEIYRQKVRILVAELSRYFKFAEV